jgi:segregation and condensation protein B
MGKETTLLQKLEAVLFYVAEPVEVAFLAKTLEVGKKEVEDALEALAVDFSERGLRIVRHEETVALVTAPELSDTIEKLIKEERERDLGRAGIETLAIIAYKGPVSKKEIEYIRGVNSQYALRNLLLRGLVEKKEGTGDARVVLYSITGEALQHLGLQSLSELPEYEESKRDLSLAADDAEGDTE